MKDVIDSEGNSWRVLTDCCFVDGFITLIKVGTQYVQSFTIDEFYQKFPK